jgi:hypothetical protein
MEVSYLTWSADAHLAKTEIAPHQKSEMEIT